MGFQISHPEKTRVPFGVGISESFAWWVILKTDTEMSRVENSTVVTHKTLVCFSAGSSWCVLPKCFGHSGHAWPPPISGHMMPDVGWPSSPSPCPGCGAGSVQ